MIKVIFGDLAFSGLYNLAVPDWYREGDAVFTETKWTSQGRGRLSSFTLPFHQKLMQGDPWNYYMVRNGSYRQFTPDIYPMGYMMKQYGNHVFGEETWDTILSEAAAYKHLTNPFSGGVQERIGKRNKHLYAAAMEWYREQWKAEKSADVTYPLVDIPEQDLKEDYFEMTFPEVDVDGKIYSAISTFDRTTAIYTIDLEGQRRKVVSMGLQQDSYFDHSNHRFIWSEIRFDPRWVRRDKTVIVVYDENEEKKIEIEPEKGYFTPSLDKGGRRIVALHEGWDGKYNLQIIDARSGGILATLPNEKNLYLGYPIWSEDELQIIATARDKYGRMALMRQNIETGEITNITQFTFSLLGKPNLAGEWIYLTTDIDKLDQVYAVDKNEGIFYQVSTGNTAHYDPSWDPIRGEIVCSEYTLQGKKLVRLPGSPKNWTQENLGSGVRDVQFCADDLCAPLIPDRPFEVTKYSPWSGAINFHSVVAGKDGSDYNVEVRSLNIMNNVSLDIGYRIYTNGYRDLFDGGPLFTGPYVNLELGMWYPVLSFGFSQISAKHPENKNYTISNNRINAGVSLPLFYSSGIFQQNVFLSSTYSAGLSKIRPVLPQLGDINFNYLTHQAILINSRRKAYRQAYPTWAQRGDVSYSHELNGIEISQFYLSGDLALPAFALSHYTLVHAEYLSQDTSIEALQLSSSYRGARGFDVINSEIQYGGGITYGFPVAYPDRGIGNIFYTRRIRLQPFFDMAYTNAKNDDDKWIMSTGLEAIIDFDFPPVSIGLRYVRLLNSHNGKPDHFELFFPVTRF
ncbi:MAG: hypothetical protein ABIQ11_08755 [Saprospiraceae bacterium]